MSWSKATIGDVVTIARSGVAPEDIESGTTYVGLEHIDSSGEFVEVAAVEKGDLASTKFRFTSKHVLFGKLRPYLKKTARPNFGGVCSTDILPLEPTKHIDRDYLFHVLRRQSFVDEVTSLCAGANLPRLSPKVLASMQVPLPPMVEQRRIAAILDKADALRAKRREAIGKLEQLLQSVFLDMFGDPTTNSMGWPTTTLEEISDQTDRINYGVVQPGEEFLGGIPLVRVGDIEGGELDARSIKRISPEIESSYTRSRLRGNEILISCVGSIGTVALVPESAIGFNIARAITRIPLRDPARRVFVQACLRASAAQNYFKEKTRTVSQPTLNVEFVKLATIFAPPIEDQERFAQIAGMIDRQKLMLRTGAKHFESLFASLQYRAFSDTF